MPLSTISYYTLNHAKSGVKLNFNFEVDNCEMDLMELDLIRETHNQQFEILWGNQKMLQFLVCFLSHRKLSQSVCLHSGNYTNHLCHSLRYHTII